MAKDIDPPSDPGENKLELLAVRLADRGQEDPVLGALELVVEMAGVVPESEPMVVVVAVCCHPCVEARDLSGRRAKPFAKVGGDADCGLVATFSQHRVLGRGESSGKCGVDRHVFPAAALNEDCEPRTVGIVYVVDNRKLYIGAQAWPGRPNTLRETPTSR